MADTLITDIPFGTNQTRFTACLQPIYSFIAAKFWITAQALRAILSRRAGQTRFTAFFEKIPLAVPAAGFFHTAAPAADFPFSAVSLNAPPFAFFAPFELKIPANILPDASAALTHPSKTAIKTGLAAGLSFVNHLVPAQGRINRRGLKTATRQSRRKERGERNPPSHFLFCLI